MSGKRIDFSWTWYENRKKDIAEFRSAYGSSARNGARFAGVGVSASGVLGFFEIRNLLARSASRNTVGRNPASVNKADRFTTKSGRPHLCHLMKTLDAHQKFATLSSKRPRANGNIRVIGSRMVAVGAKGGRKGRKRRKNVKEVTIAKRTKRITLVVTYSA